MKETKDTGSEVRVIAEHLSKQAEWLFNNHIHSLLGVGTCDVIFKSDFPEMIFHFKKLFMPDTLPESTIPVYWGYSYDLDNTRNRDFRVLMLLVFSEIVKHGDF